LGGEPSAVVEKGEVATIAQAKMSLASPGRPDRRPGRTGARFRVVARQDVTRDQDAVNDLYREVVTRLEQQHGLASRAPDPEIDEA